MTSRRRFLQLGLGTAPVIVSLYNRPALARSCLTVSATASLAADPLTSAAHGIHSCLGSSPGRWLNQESLKQLYGVTGGPTFLSIFGFLWGANWTVETRFGDVLSMNSTDDPGHFGASLVAAYSNATKYAGSYPLQPAEVVAMGRAVKTKGYFTVPTTNQSWGMAEVKQFIEQTYTLG